MFEFCEPASVLRRGFRVRERTGVSPFLVVLAFVLGHQAAEVDAAADERAAAEVMHEGVAGHDAAEPSL